MQAVLDNTDAAIVYSDLLLEQEDGNRSVWKRPPSDIRERCYIGPAPMWRRALHDNYGMFDESYTVAGDYEFWARVLTADERVAYIPRPLVVYRKRGLSLEHRHRDKCITETASIRERYNNVP
jgi:hypothetical protein